MADIPQRSKMSLDQFLYSNALQGPRGKSAYEVWLEAGNTGTEADFIAALNSAATLVSAYQVWINLGNTGTEADFLASLQGADGLDGTDGLDGADGANGTAGVEGTAGAPGFTGSVGPAGPAGAPGPIGPAGPAGDVTLVQDNVEILNGQLTGITNDWFLYRIPNAPPQGRIARVNILSETTNATHYDILLSNSDTTEGLPVVLKYEDVPTGGYRLDSEEAIQYNGILYIGVRFNEGSGSTIEYQIDIQTQGDVSICNPASNYRTIPQLPSGTTLASYIPTLHDLTEQVDGSENVFTLNQPAVVDSILVMLNGIVLRPDTGGETGDYSITNESTITMNYAPSSNSSLLTMYIEQ